MPLRTLSQEDWEQWRSSLIDLYRHQTADYIAGQLRRQHGLNVTAKMLRDRLKTWNAEAKYRKKQHPQPRRQRQRMPMEAAEDPIWTATLPNIPPHLQAPFNENHGRGVQVIQSAFGTQITNFAGQIENHTSRYWTQSLRTAHGPMLVNYANPFVSLEPTRALDSPRDERHLQMTLKEVTGYIDRIVEEKTWIYRHEEPAFELQKLAAKAHMAISSQSYDSHQIWYELDSLYSPVCKVIPRFDENGLLTMHPRALTVLLRLLVDSLSSEPWASETLKRVKRMFGAVSSQALRAIHPVRLLCGMPKHSSRNLLFRLLELMDVRLFARVSEEQPHGPRFVAQEQTYAARVLASLGYTEWADVKLQSVIGNLDTHKDPFTGADAFRTLGYNCEQASATMFGDRTEKLQEAKAASAYALKLFVEMSKGHTNEAMYTHVSLSQICRQLGDLPSTELHLIEAINIWPRLRPSDGQAAKLILDLNQVLVDQGKFEEARELKEKYAEYFEESRGFHDVQGD